MFLTVYYVPEPSSLLTAIGAKLIGPHSGLQVGKYMPSLMNGLRGMTHYKFFSQHFSISEGQKGMGHSTPMST